MAYRDKVIYNSKLFNAAMGMSKNCYGGIKIPHIADIKGILKSWVATGTLLPSICPFCI